MSLTLTTASFAQESPDKFNKGQIGISFSSFGESESIHFKRVDGGGSFDGNDFYTLGLTYLKPINKTLSLETGLEYSNFKTIVKFPPNFKTQPISGNLSLLTIPLSLRVNFLNYVFINGGLFLGFQTGKSTGISQQNGIGGSLGAGLKYDFENGISIFANPYLKIHSLLPFSPGRYHQRLLENGFRFGIMYRLK
jgi:hypothetical protein